MTPASKRKAAAASEYGAEFRTDVETFISAEAVAAVVEPECRERPRRLRVNPAAEPEPATEGPSPAPQPKLF